MAVETDAATGPREDAELMRRVKLGDEDALAGLMHRWELPVKAVIGRMLCNAREAEELAQEAFVRVWQHRERFDSAQPVKPWLLGIAVNLARNRLRWWKRRPLLALDDWDEVPRASGDSVRAGSAGLERAEKVAAVRQAIAALPLDLREAFVLFEYEDMSYAEIATALGVTAKAVENRIARAREKLRAALKAWV